MLCLSVLPSSGSGLPPVDVQVRAEPHATVGDLAAALGQHLVGVHSKVLLAPVSEGRVWPSGRMLTETGLYSGQLLAVEAVPDSWRTAPDGRSPRVQAVVEVLEGPDVGRTFAVADSAATIGRAADSTVVLTDPQVSRNHARLMLGADPVIADAGSSGGTRLSGRRVDRPTSLHYGDTVQVGDTVLSVRDGTAGAGRIAAERTGRPVTRTPRFGNRVLDAQLELPTPPAEPARRHFPWAMMTLPVVMGASMMASMGAGRSLLYVVGWPVAMLAGHLIERRQQRKDYDAELAAWRADCAEIVARAAAAADDQRAQAFADEPDPADLPARLATRRLVWARHAGDPDFLSVRVGIGPVPARTSISPGHGLPPAALREEIRDLVARAAQIPAMPVTVDLATARLVSLTGPEATVDAALTSLLMRLAVSHSPFDVAIAAVLSPGRRELEGVLRWLPHALPRPGGDPSVAIGAADGRALLESLQAAGDQHIVCVVDEDAGIPRRVIETVASAGGPLTLIWLGRSRHSAPAATGVLVDLGEDGPVARPGHATHGPAVLLAGRAGVLPLDAADQLDLRTAWDWGRALAGMRDVAAVIPPDNALAGSVRMDELGPDLSDLDDDTQILGRWRAARGLRAQIGVGIDGTVSLDLREDGPHGLVAGTTGAGKSELLQSLIVSLAANNSPQRITFLLVDYKGGAAFRECAQLPHTVGYITDLTPALVQRALVSMNAELTWREELLARHGAKDLIALERLRPDVAPPSMLICVDEFAALLAEVPDFIDGMVSIAQRGRSLGMHMILATQRPSGVISEQIKANTDLRIALRVASGDDSRDVIDTPDAAGISRRTPGRAFVRRTGHGTCELVQVAYVGGRQLRADALAPVRIRPHSATGAAAGGASTPGRSGARAFAPQSSVTAGAPAAETASVHERTDLDRLVRSITRAHKASGQPDPRLPWLPALPERLDHTAPAQPPDGAELVVGLVDDPAAQRQLPLRLDLARAGHVLVYGASGSGKTAMLRTCAIAAMQARADAPFLIYGIDAAGGTLRGLDGLPAVGSVVPATQLERTLRLLRMMRRTIDERNALLAAHGAADIADLAAGGVAVSRLLVLIDNLPALLDLVDTGPMARRVHAAHLQAVLSDGRRCGVHVVATSPQRSGLPLAVTAAFGSRVVLRMTSEDDYQMLGVPARILSPDSPPGRALAGTLEAQVAFVAADAPVLEQACAHWRQRHPDAGDVVPAVPAMPDRVPAGALPAGTGGTVYLGVDADLVTAVGLDLASAPLLVTGRPRSGRTSVLAGIAAQMRRTHPDATLLAVIPRLGAGDSLAQAGCQVIDDPVALVAALTTLPDGAAVLVDDLHLWEARWSEPEIRAGLTALTALADDLAAGVRSGIALVCTTGADQLRDAAMQPSVTAAFKRIRRAAMIEPSDADGIFFGCDVPASPPEPLAGPGRALLAESGRGRVVQLVG